MSALKLLLVSALLLFSTLDPAYSATVVGPNCKLGWQFPQDQNLTIDGFRLYVDGKATGTALNTVRTMLCGTLAPGERRLELTAFKGSYESGKSALLLVVYVPPTSDTGQLSALSDIVSGTVDLSAEGTVDWVHWGLTGATSVTRKSGASTQIGALTMFGGSPTRFDDGLAAPVRYTWSGGTPSATATTSARLILTGTGKGFQLTAPADTDERTLTVYVNLYLTRGRIDASLSDASAPAIVKTEENLTGGFNRRLSIRYRAGSPGQTLTVRWTQEITGGSGGNVSIGAATLRLTVPVAPVAIEKPTGLFIVNS
jgi:hypothetical protein